MSSKIKPRGQQAGLAGFSAFMQQRRGMAIGVFLLAALLYGQFGFNGKLVRDDAIWLYGGQQMAQGTAPYVSIFDFKSPLAPMTAGLAAWTAKQVKADDIFFVRGLFFLISCAAAAALFCWAHGLFRSRGLAALTTIIFMCFWGFARHAGSGPQAKSLMVLMQIMALYFGAGHQWFLSGLFGSLAAWSWQPAIIFPAFTLAAAMLQPDRYRALVRSASGILAPSVLIVGYFFSQGAFASLWQGAVLFNLQQLHRGAPLAQHLKAMAYTLADAFPGWIYVIAWGNLAMPFVYRWRYRQNHCSWRAMIQNDP